MSIEPIELNFRLFITFFYSKKKEEEARFIFLLLICCFFMSQIKVKCNFSILKQIKIIFR